MKVIGNSEAWKQLVKEMPPAALLTGVDGVGRRTGALAIARKVSAGNDFDGSTLKVQDATRLAAWASRSTGRKIAVVSADATTGQAWNVLLRVLEELPPKTHVWIVADGDVPPAIRGRCSEITFGELEPDAVLRVAKTQGMVTPEEAELLPSKTFRSFAALQSEQRQLARLSNVQAWLEGVERGSREDVFDSVAVWSRDATALLVRDLEQQYAGRHLLGVKLTRPSKDSIIRAIAELVRGESPKVSALVAGTYLIDSTT